MCKKSPAPNSSEIDDPFCACLFVHEGCVCVCVTPHNIIEHLYDYKLGIIDIDLILPDNLSKDDDLSVLCSDV